MHHDVSVSNAPTADANGADIIRHRGTPTVRQRVSGAGTVQNE